MGSKASSAGPFVRRVFSEEERAEREPLRAAFNEAVLLAGWPEDLVWKEFGRPRGEKLARKRIDPWPPQPRHFARGAI